jgi:acetyltransferase-like isoleucine patch superfamily enzyme
MSNSEPERKLVIRKIRRAIARDGIYLGLARSLARGVAHTAAKANARLHGIDGSLPIGSQVSGTRFMSIGEDFRVHGPAWIEAITEYAGVSHTPRITVGRSFRASDRLHISAITRVSIGDNCLFGSSVFVGDHAHGSYKDQSASDPSTVPAMRPLGNQGQVTIGDRCWIGDNVTILGPVRVGEGSVIAANSVVTSDIPSGSLAAGAPARVIKFYDEELRRWVRTRHDIRATEIS